MAKKLPLLTLNLKQFMKRREVLQLYRECLTTIKKIDNTSDQLYFWNWARDDFRKYKNETNEETINYHIARARKFLKDLSTTLQLSK